MYTDLIHTFESLEDDEAGRLIKHFLRYVNNMNPIAPDKITQIAFEPIKQQLKRDLVKWLVIKDKRSLAGKASADKKKQITTNSTSVESVQQVPTNSTVSVNVNVIDNVNVINKEKEILNSMAWIEQTAMFLKVKINWVEIELKNFIAEQKLKTDFEKRNIEDLRNHFINVAKKLPKTDKPSNPLARTIV